MFTIEDFKSGLNKFLKIGEVLDEKGVITIKNRDLKIQIDSKEIIEIIEELNAKGSYFKDNELYNDDSLEERVDTANTPYVFFRHERFDKYKVNTDLYNIEISCASKQYLIATICSIDINSIEYKRACFYPHIAESDNYDFWHWTEQMIGVTCKIQFKGENKWQLKEMRHYLTSYLFNIAFNYNECILPINNIVRKRSKIWKDSGGQLAPLRLYNLQVVDYYNQGLAADTPFSQYLAFYHVLEFYFQSVIEEDTFKYVKDELTKPSFSLSSKREINAFIKGIRKKIDNQKENSSQGEKFALELCLKKYLVLSDLIKRLNSVDSNCLDYYKNNKVSFAQNSAEIDFSINDEIIYQNLSKRIYDVRNAIVHSKDCDKLRYQPFNNDDELRREIPLIKSIAEIIIINTAGIAKS